MVASDIDLNAITREVGRVRHAHMEIQNHIRPGAVTGYLICVEQSADDVPYLANTITKLTLEIRQLYREAVRKDARITELESMLGRAGGDVARSAPDAATDCH